MKNVEIKIAVSRQEGGNGGNLGFPYKESTNDDKGINRLIHFTDQLEKCDKKIAKLKNDLGYNNIKRMMIKHKLEQINLDT